MSLRNGYVWIELGRTRGPDGVVRRKGAYEHRLIWAAAHGPIPSGHHVHHLNGDRTDNRLSNLALISRAAHGKLHHGDGKARGGRWSRQHESCVVCGTISRPHYGLGRCHRCYIREYYHRAKARTATL